MSKIKLAVIFGGMSTEHDISVISGTSVLENLDKSKYEIFPIYISKEGQWYKYKKDINKIETLKLEQDITEKERIQNILEYLKQMEVIFPVLHGLGGEDGTIQGLLELIKVPYVGCKVLASSIGMDKAYTKMIFDKANLNQVKYEYIIKNKKNYTYVDKQLNQTQYNLEQLIKIIQTNIKFPMFIKPSNSGSSVGISKAKDEEELKKAIEYATNFDNKVLIEEGIEKREVECAVLGNEEVIASCVGEIKPAEEFYSFDAKYKSMKSITEIPAKIDEKIQDEIKKLAIKAFKAIDGNGLARVDFFIENNTNKIYINEINTMPGFTKISMYPKLFGQIGISYKDLLNKLIELAKDNK